MNADDKIPFITLLDWLDGRLDHAVAARMIGHLADASPEERESMEWLRWFLMVTRTEREAKPPPMIRQRLAQAYARRGQGTAGPERTVPVTPSAVFDSRRDLAVGGVRGAAPAGESVHLAFMSEDADLVLDVTTGPTGHLDIAGQVFLPVATTAPVFEATVRAAEGEVRCVDGDRFGRFHFSRLPTPVRHLTATNGEVTLDLPLDL